VRTFEEFRIAVPDRELADLRHRLTATRWLDQLPGSAWEYGTDLDYLKEMVRYWAEDYDWRRYEAELNRYPQFVTTLLGQRVHLFHVRSLEPQALPLVLTHGWPGSVSEFLHVLGPLSDPRRHGGDPADAFHLVVPSLPGFGFSGPTTERGWGMHRIAQAWRELMGGLGYARYGAQGGDWGCAVSRCLAAIDPGRVCGVHLNMLTTPPPGDHDDLAHLTDRERAAFARAGQNLATGRGYVEIQSTRPQTLAYGLTDSPVGLLAWIADKFWAWTDHNGSPDEAVARDEIITNVSIYWFTRTAGSSARLYYESFGGPGPVRPDPAGLPPVRAPLGVAVFPHDIAASRRSWVAKADNLVHWSEMDRGGHFAALEEPDLLVADIRAFFRALR
jgi:pimeloyl-ACP methyl ester carboxylesterase